MIEALSKLPPLYTIVMEHIREPSITMHYALYQKER
jgi:hypothetical protein